MHEDAATLDCVDGAHGAGIVEMEVDILASLSSDRWQLVSLVDRYSDPFARYELLQNDHITQNILVSSEKMLYIAHLFIYDCKFS